MQIFDIDFFPLVIAQKYPANSQILPKVTSVDVLCFKTTSIPRSGGPAKPGHSASDL